MWKKYLSTLGMALMLTLGFSVPVLAETTTEVTMENCGAYLYGWRPVDCGDGRYFVILSGDNNIQESNVVLNKGYDFAYTFNTSFSRPWGQVPELVNMNGVWGIPDNQSLLPEGNQAYTRMVLITNNKKLSTKERYIDIVHLPSGIPASSLPPEVRKYLINTDGSDAGAYEGTQTAGWTTDDNGNRLYQKADGSYVINSWLTIDDKSYYMDGNGFMLKDNITPDGVYVNTNGERTAYMPGWVQDEKGWRYIQKNGYYAGATWIQSEDGKWYYLNIGTYMEINDTTPDGYYVDSNGAWDGQPSTMTNSANLGPGMSTSTGWESAGSEWKYKQDDGTYVTSSWKEENDKWYYFDENSLMVTNKETPDGYYVNSEGVWE